MFRLHLFIGYILNHYTDPVKNELVFGVLNLLFFKQESNNCYIKGNNFDIPFWKLDRVSGFLLYKQISVSASLTNELSGWIQYVYYWINT
nr:MAG TPA: hypothetical protein [Caudoviricetes sp.]